MAVLHTEPPLTRVQFYELDRDGDSIHRHSELIDGQLVYLHGRFEDGRFVNSPSYAHQVVVRELLVALTLWCRAASERGAVLHELDVPLPGRQDVLKPDLLCWPAARISSRGPSGVPALVVEVMSPSSRRHDLGVKRTRYVEAGVDEIWLVDPLGRTAVIDRGLPAQRARRGIDLDDTGVLTSPLLPGFRVRLAELGPS